MSPSTQREKAEAFRQLHHGPRVLLLPNAWDAVSARIFEDAGFPAIATTSAGVAFAQGYPDGEFISRDAMIAQVAIIVRAVKIPVTADVEAGYGDSPDAAALTAKAVIAAGAVGMNLEDTSQAAAGSGNPLLDLAGQLEKLQAVREVVKAAGVPLVLNARTDVYLESVGAAETRYDETIRRLSAYRDAGADCVFAPGIRDAETIRRLVADLACPLNILAGPGSLSVPELEQLGVRRVSLGSGPIRATLGLLARMACELRAEGTYSAMADAIPHAVVNQMMKRG